MRRFTFSKGHGTRNDFIIIDDQHGMHDLGPDVISAICDRRSGIGADGVLRVVRAQHVPEWTGDPDLWFMDYRNADGSIAEMCGNGLRVFARHLVNEQWVPTGDFTVATRAGLRRVLVARGGLISTSLGAVTISDEPVEVTHFGRRWPATAVDVGNPHAVVFVDDDTRSGLDLTKAPSWEPAQRFPHGTNIEFVSVREPGVLDMRVYERGSGETESCGTGVVASAAAHRAASGHTGPVVVHVRGGELTVEFDGREAWLTGPAVVFARGEFWWL
ncbi:diaminopimelate epimerase [Tessaracoccus antarcticus]|uniref:Diaminopimelate epimerase n=2 Tax=Tessaracoccus antarcticus TaxID=2479848 RepID=A0A3M0G910_9ACTN|nr:diaminopimelate epimerase [Tessaracoccus antarcticus]